MALQQQNGTSQLQQARLQDLSTHSAVHLQEEIPEKRQERLQNMSACQPVRLEEETLEKRQEKLIIAGQIMHTSTNYVCLPFWTVCLSLCYLFHTFSTYVTGHGKRDRFNKFWKSSFVHYRVE